MIGLLLGFVLFIVFVYVYPIVKLVLTDTQITKSFFFEQYYAKISSNEYDFNVFLNYMKPLVGKKM